VQVYLALPDLDRPPTEATSSFPQLHLDRLGAMMNSANLSGSRLMSRGS
jgi:hypothetical protein